ncbi:putative biotin transporter BioYB [Paraliobacillus quinghaiensis]|uniref:Biotin transporter n=1 Tax=Paraliobacillus quinghaiensis TaxID=470815 RepID=A0A917TLT6_9BACI|nr:biotin transporter BioY [Paraliobacillus quinghaiensis]GGM28147.1 putative biotin transporter BioYB [Paraliobacillus quinghaiensis]
MKLRAIDITLSGMFAALMAIGANITSFIVIGGVPITLTTFFCILAGLLLGSRLGSIAMIVYALIGLAGAPVFSKFSGGLSVIVSPTFGFILSYIIVAYVVGKIVEWKPSKRNFILAALIGFVINYVFGTNWMYFSYKYLAASDAISYSVAWSWMILPLPKDIILSILAGVLAPRLYKNINRNMIVLKDKSIA